MSRYNLSMKKLDVPTVSVSDFKKSPKQIIEEARTKKTGVYVLNHGKPTAVVLGVDDYETLINSYEAMKEKIADLELVERLPELKKEASIPVSEVIDDIPLDDNNEWE